MPQTKQSAKDLRKTKRRTIIRKATRSDLKTKTKKVRQTIDQKTAKIETLKDILTQIDKAVQKGIIKKNAGARKKSRLMKRFHKATQSK